MTHGSLMPPREALHSLLHPELSRMQAERRLPALKALLPSEHLFYCRSCNVPCNEEASIAAHSMLSMTMSSEDGTSWADGLA